MHLNYTPHLRTFTLSFALGALATLSLRAQSQEESAVTAEEATLVGRENVETAYVLETAETATRTSTLLRHTPVSVQVVPAQVLKDQGALGLEDAYLNVSGVVESGNTLNAQSEIRPVIRGFESPVVFRNGMRAADVGAVDLANIDRIEVLKGPASILFGAVEPGGLLNIVTKQPLEAPYVDFSQSFGSENFFRTEADASGPVGLEGVYYRLNGAYTNSESFRDHIELDRFTLAPVLAWRPSDVTEVLLDFQYTREFLPYDSGVPFGSDNQPLVDIDTFFGDPALDGRDLEDLFASTRLTHRFNDHVEFRTNFQLHYVQAKNESVRHRGVREVGGDLFVRARYQNEDRQTWSYQNVTEVVLDFETGPVEHTLLAGFDLLYEEADFDRARFNLPTTAIPVSNNPQTDVDDFIPSSFDRQPQEAFLSNRRWFGFFLQDQHSMLDDRLHLLVGGRVDVVTDENELTATEETFTGYTGRIGLLYEVTGWLAPYASMTQSFNPQSLGTEDEDGELIDPERGFQYEAGFKFSFFEDRLVSTLAAFYIEKSNVAVFDPTFTYSDPGGSHESYGMEFDVTGQITDGLRVIANYAYTETEWRSYPDFQNAVDLTGRALGNVPEHAARLWLAYDFTDRTFLEGLGLGFGVRYEDNRFAQFDDTELADFTIFDAAVWYTHEFKNGIEAYARLNLYNLFDREYYTRASDQSIVHPGEPFGLRATLGIEF